LVLSGLASFTAATYVINFTELTDRLPAPLRQILAPAERPRPAPPATQALPPAPQLPAHHGSLVQTQFAQCRQFFPTGQMPEVPRSAPLRELCFSDFAVLYSGQTKTPVFAAERLNRNELSQASEQVRTDRFYAEARLPQAERAVLEDYHGSGYARGHMAPAGDRSTKEAMAQSFSLANMVPQNPTQNSGSWSHIEQDTRKYALRAAGDVYVFTGPVYGGTPQRIGTGGVAVPSYLYKVVYDPAKGRAWVYWQANNAQAKAGPPISYDEFVQRTGLQLLPDMAGS
jgi:endonuclease G